MLSLEPFYRRNRWREKLQGYSFKRWQSGLAWLSKAFLLVFFTPLVVLSNLLIQDILLVLTNIILAAGFLSTFFYNIHYNQFTRLELLLNSIAILAAMTFGVVFAGGALSAGLSSMSLSTLSLAFLNYANAIAICINILFAAQHLVFKPTYLLLKYWMMRSILGRTPTPRYKTFDTSRDYFPLQHLSQQYYADGPENLDQVKQDFDKIIKLLTNYIIKYQTVLFGGPANQDKIELLETGINKLLTEGVLTADTVGFLQRKISFKETKIRLLRNGKNAVQTILQQHHPAKEKTIGTSSRTDQSYQQLRPYIALQPNCTLPTTVNSFNQLFDAEIKRQEIKLEGLQTTIQAIIKP